MPTDTERDNSKPSPREGHRLRGKASAVGREPSIPTLPNRREPPLVRFGKPRLLSQGGVTRRPVLRRSSPISSSTSLGDERDGRRWFLGMIS